MKELGRRRLAVRSYAGQVELPAWCFDQVEGCAGSCFANVPATDTSIPACINSAASKLVFLPVSQFIEQHAQAVEVAPSVNIQGAHLGLFRTHVGGRADELFEGGEKCVIGQFLCVALAMPKSMTFGTGTPSFMVTKDVGRLDIG